MKFTLREPCAGCPFRKDIPIEFWNGRIAEMVEAVLEKEVTFVCHKTNAFDGQGELADSNKTQLCAGAMIILEKLGRRTREMQEALDRGEYDPARLNLSAPVYAGKEEMFAAAEKCVHTTHWKH